MTALRVADRATDHTAKLIAGPPEAAVLTLPFLPQFVPSGAPKLPTMVVLAAVWAVYEIGYYSLYVWCVSRRPAVARRAGSRAARRARCR